MRHPRNPLLFALLAGLALTACQSGPIYYEIGTIHRAVTTNSPEAQRWFDRGLAHTYGFNHEHAITCFDQALAADGSCAMAYWGKANALGPNYNNAEVTPEANAAALAALGTAASHLDACSDAERALIAAQGKRFAEPLPKDRAPLDRAYADAMRKVRRDFPDDPDVAALTAEALMQLLPWKLWSPDGKAAAITPEIRGVLEPALARWPDHPALCHLYIHTMEAGPEVAKALPCAERLETLAPGLGHLVHMPSHAYVWTGRYDDVVRVNQAAVAVDRAFADAFGRSNFYTLYRLHDLHFVAYGAMWSGRRAVALQAARQIREEIPPELLKGYVDYLDVFTATPLHVMVRFGMWDEILAEPEPDEDLLAAKAVWRYARGIAFASLSRVEEAEAEARAFRAARAAVPASRLLFNNPVKEILAVADKVLGGELSYRRGEFDQAFAKLRQGVVLDETLNYDEPWGWMEPARHALGALLTEQERFEEAISVYERDLQRYPENGWALHGLAECLRATGQVEEAKAVQARFERAFANADVTIPGSCFCKTK